MSFNVFVEFSALVVGSMAVATLLVRRQKTKANVAFSFGMIALATQCGLDALSQLARTPQVTAYWQTLALGTELCLPLTWIYFSLVYARGNYREFLSRWRLVLLAAGLLPVTWLVSLLAGAPLIAVGIPSRLEAVQWVMYSERARMLVALLLVGVVLVFANLEKTFRSSVGVTRWRIKFMVLGLGIIFGAKVYTLSQTVLFPGHSLSLRLVDAGALLTGCFLIAVAFVRQGLREIDVYPSRAVLQSSVTVLLVGGYLLAIGLLAQIASRLGESKNFQAQVLVVLFGAAVLLVLLFSDRMRLGVGHFVSRHFQRPQHDFRDVWTLLTRRTFETRDEVSLCAAASTVISETFRVLSVTLWVADENLDQLRFVSSTSPSARPTTDAAPAEALPILPARGAEGPAMLPQPFDLETASGEWAEALRRANPRQFPASGGRLGVPLATGEQLVGVAILADRVNSVAYTVEELDLLGCVGEQVAARLLNLRLTGSLVQAKEMEAFQTMSTFFVHDLKNAAYSLGLMLENLPVHFDDPEFRADALRGIGSTVSRINYLIERLGTLRRKLEAEPTPLDLNQLVAETLDSLPGAPGIEIRRELRLASHVSADREQIQSVLSNLVLNARDSLEREGCVQLETDQREGHATLIVTDNGCGMSAEFVRDLLFRPFYTTKKKGMGIGMFQSKMMIEANRGTIQVESVLGKGTTFRITLPLAANL